MLRRVNKMQPSQSNWNFPDFPPVPLSKPELLKLTIIMKLKCITSLDDNDANFHLDRKKRNIFPRILLVVTFLVWRYSLK